MPALPWDLARFYPLKVSKAFSIRLASSRALADNQLDDFIVFSPNDGRSGGVEKHHSAAHGSRVRITRLHSCAMKIPHGDVAIVDRQKLTEYCLNLEHPRGKHKARVFATLGFTAENAEELRAALLRAAASGDAQPAASDEFGDRYI